MTFVLILNLVLSALVLVGLALTTWLPLRLLSDRGSEDGWHRRGERDRPRGPFAPLAGAGPVWSRLWASSGSPDTRAGIARRSPAAYVRPVERNRRTAARTRRRQVRRAGLSEPDFGEPGGGRLGIPPSRQAM